MDFETHRSNANQNLYKYKFDPMDFETCQDLASSHSCIKYKFDPMDFETRLLKQYRSTGVFSINLILWILKRKRIF